MEGTPLPDSSPPYPGFQDGLLGDLDRTGSWDEEAGAGSLVHNAEDANDLGERVGGAAGEEAPIKNRLLSGNVDAVAGDDKYDSVKYLYHYYHCFIIIITNIIVMRVKWGSKVQ